uniref:Putative secreted protein n=1 Tax=Ixodes ricinus TaxID=34613 RepID=V5H0V3_IXORI
MRSIFQVFLGQLRLLMGLPDTRPKEGLHVMDGSVCSDLGVDFLLRRRTQDLLVHVRFLLVFTVSAAQHHL